MVRWNDRRNATGFSLLEVLVAVVVLTVGLLALAALQGSLTRASAEAKARGRVSAMLTARIDDMRNDGYGNLAPEGTPAPYTSTINDACDNDGSQNDMVDCARDQAGLGSLTVSQTITTWYGDGTFNTPAPLPAAQNPRTAQFKRVDLSATWQDAVGGSHTVQLVSDVSSMALTNFIVVPPESTENPTGGPIVRTINPTAAGVIPIAIGPQDETQNTATLNPTPELVGQGNNIKPVGTRFSVLTYTPPTTGDSSVVVTRRFDNEVVKCSCRYGAGGNNLPEIYRTPLWPAIWTGERYEVHVPESNAAPPGQAAQSGPRNGATQSALCQECCRDHHDTGTGVEFDPERPGDNVKWDLNNQGNLVQVNNTNSATYVDSCRLVRIDGFWRTASDLYQRQFGLLETESQGGAAAKTGVPTTNAVSQYTTFVKGFLNQYSGSSGNPPADAQSLFTTGGPFDTPALVTIATPNATDYRYLHARGLYVDHLESKALEQITKARADDPDDDPCPDTGNVTSENDCVLQYIPFTTVNLTEIADWKTQTPDILTINTGNLLSTTPAQPSGGRTIGNTGGSANNDVSMRRSNSGIGVNLAQDTLKAVDDDDVAVYGDMQPFQVGGSNGPTFDVRVSGAGANPFVFFTLGSDIDRECLKPAGTDHRCTTSAGTTLPQQGTLVFSNYWSENFTQQHLTNVNCGGQTAQGDVDVPTFHNYALTTATINGVGGAIGLPTNDNKVAETTSVVFSAIPQGALLMIGFTEQVGSPSYATIVSCTTNGGRNQIKNVVWNRPWLTP
jgi:type IV pilus modification protein PilV